MSEKKIMNKNKKVVKKENKNIKCIQNRNKAF